jgi:hypothetical protein
MYCMIDSVILTPRDTGHGLYAKLNGALANILAACAEAETKNPSGKAEGSQLSLVAGARNHRQLTLSCIV